MIEIRHILEFFVSLHPFPFIDYIPRYLTASAELIQGVKEGENPLFTIGWNIIGSPLATVAIPLMITPSGVLPKVKS